MGALDLVTWWPVDAAAGGVVRRSVPAHATAGSTASWAGVVDDVGDIERPFQWASMTKLLVAMAVLVAVEEGTVSLDEPAGPPGSTVRHLLAHASGLGPDSPVPVAGPARMRIYSNIGYEVLAETLAERSGMLFTDYLTAGVLLPLGIENTALAPGSSPASGAQGPLRDLLTLAVELLAPAIVSAATLASATSVAFPGLRGVLPGYGRFDPCDWGLGFEVRGSKDPHWTGTLTSPATFGHFGRAGGFLWVDPMNGLACATLSNRDFGPWAVTEWSTLADAVVEQWASPRVEEETEPNRRQEKGAKAEAGRRQREAAEAEKAKAEAERRQREAAEAEKAKAEAERRQREAAEAEKAKAEAGRRQREAAEAEKAKAEAERRQREAAEAEKAKAEAERRQREAAEAEKAKAEAERRQREAAEAEKAEAEAERRQREAAEAEKAKAEAERRQREAAEAELRTRRAAEAQRQRSRDTVRAEAIETVRREREAVEQRRDRADSERRISAMSERRDSVEVRISDTQATEEEVGPLGPGIRPVDFWGSCGP